MNKKQLLNLLYWGLIAAIGLFFAYSKGWILSDFKSVSPKEAYAMIQNDPDAVILDVRTPEEYAQEHIDGAVLLPVQVLEANIGKLDAVKEKKIIVYCRSGNRSVSASRILSDHGFTPFNVSGGIGEWKSEGLDVVSGAVHN